MYGHVRRHLLVVLVLRWGCLWTWWGMLLTHAVHRMASHRKEFPGPKPCQCRSWEPLLWKPLSFHVPIYYVSNVFLIFRFFFPPPAFFIKQVIFELQRMFSEGRSLDHQNLFCIQRHFKWVTGTRESSGTFRCEALFWGWGRSDQSL